LRVRSVGDDHRQRSRASGIDEHTIKPVDPDKLLARIALGRQAATS